MTDAKSKSVKQTKFKVVFFFLLLLLFLMSN